MTRNVRVTGKGTERMGAQIRRIKMNASFLGKGRMKTVSSGIYGKVNG
jgi:hypothetical protein